MTDQVKSLQPAQTWLGPLLVLAGGVCIGFAPIGLRLGLGDLGPQAIAFWRYAFALPIVFSLVVLVQRRLPAKPNPYVIIAGICFGLDMGLWHWGLTYTSVANATFIVNLGNIGVGLTAWIFLRERPSKTWGIAVILAILGAAALSLGGASAVTEANGLSVRGDLLAFGAALLVSCYMVASKVARRSLGGLDTIFWLTAVEVCVGAVLVMVFQESWIPHKLSGFAAPLVLGIFVQVLGQGLIVTGLGYTPANIAGLLVVVQPVVAAAISWRLFGEILLPLQIGGCVLILIGIYLAQSGGKKTAIDATNGPITSV